MKKNKFFSLLFINYLTMVAWGLFAPFFAFIVAETGGSVTDISFVWGTYSLCVGVLMIVFGKIEDHQINTNKVLIVGSMLLLIASIAYYFTDSVQDILIAQLLYAIGFGVLNPVMKKTYAKTLKKGKEASEWALMDGGNMILMSGAAFLSGVLIKEFGLKSFYLAIIGVFTINLLSVLVFSRKYSK